MKILLIHTYYTIRGGEDAVFEQEVRLLSKDNEVETLTFLNKGGIRGLILFLLSIWNIFSARKLKKKILEFQPDVIHIHNLHFAGSPLLIRTAKKLGIPVVMTLHNYRLLCPSATLLYNGKIFTESLYVNFPWKVVKNKMYRNSFFQTFWLAFVTWFHRKIGTWAKVDKFIVLTEFAKQQFINSTFGISEEKFVVKPNFIENEVLPKTIERSDEFLFVGRLSVEKGIDVLLQAFSNSEYKLVIAGEGDLLERVKIHCKKNKNIRYLGRLNHKEILGQMQKSTTLIFPSVWYEGMPMTIVESFSTGTPVICSQLGSMSEMITDEYNGLLFEAGNAEDLKKKLHEWLVKTETEKEKMRNNAYAEYQEKYTPEINKQLLENVYLTLCKPND